MARTTCDPSGRGDRLSARQQVPDQPCAGAGGVGRRPIGRTARAALARHPADGRRSPAARLDGRHQRRRLGDHAGSRRYRHRHRLRPRRHRDAVRPAGRGAVRRHDRLRRRRPHAGPPGRPGARRAAGARASRSTTAAAARCRSPYTRPGPCPAAPWSSTPRRRRSSSRLCCSRGPVRPRRRRPARRQAGPVAAAHRDDGGDAARARRLGRRRRRQPLGRRAGTDPGTGPAYRARPFQRRTLRGARRGDRGLDHRPRLAPRDDAGG